MSCPNHSPYRLQDTPAGVLVPGGLRSSREHADKVAPGLLLQKIFACSSAVQSPRDPG